MYKATTNVSVRLFRLAFTLVHLQARPGTATIYTTVLMSRARQIDLSKFEVISLPVDAILIPVGSTDPSLGLIQRSLTALPLADQCRFNLALENECNDAIAQYKASGWPSSAGNVCLSSSILNNVSRTAVDEYGEPYLAIHLGNGYSSYLNIANAIALGHVAESILSGHGIAANEALGVFLSHKQRILHYLRDELDPAYGRGFVFIPPSLDSVNMVDAMSSPNIAEYLNVAGIKGPLWTKFLAERLSIICLPTKHYDGTQVHWRNTYIPNVVCATLDEIIKVVSAFYHLQGLLETRGVALEDTDVQNLMDSIPSQYRALLNYVLAKFCSDPLSRSKFGLDGGMSI